MKTADLRRKFIEFYAARGHAAIPSVSLIPENDPSTLFTSSGMQPLVPYLLGQTHPEGTRLVNSQKSFRAQDIEEVGDNRHTTFFEMLGNWSLGDYFKHEQLPWVFEFLTKEIGLDPSRLYVSVFEGEGAIVKDTISIEIWKNIFKTVGMDAKEGERIFSYPARKNWWSRSGEPQNMPPGEPGGPDSEIFFEYPHVQHDPAFGEKCHPNCDCGRYVEIGNSVFMQYQKQSDGSLKELAQKNVDFGGGLERLVAATEGHQDVFKIDIFAELIEFIEQSSGKKYESDAESTRAMRIIADHARAATMLMADGAMPSNKTQGYVVRRLIRRAIRFARILGVKEGFVAALGEKILQMYADSYPIPAQRRQEVLSALEAEEKKFNAMIGKGLKEIEKIPELTGQNAFKLFETYGFPWEMTEEIARERGQKIDRAEFEAEFKRHQDLSRTAAKGMFKGGLADHGDEVVRLHTATHLMHQALRDVLGAHVSQKGSNITAERLRFDFSHPQKVTPEEITKVEEIVNQQIERDLKISNKVTTYDAAIHEGALAFFGERYPENVKVYTIGDYSKEICGGPHVESTKVLKSFKILREEASSAGTRRIYASIGANEKGA
jgi:alanyl-tRNA synthetase